MLLSVTQGAEEPAARRAVAPELLPLEVLPVLGKEWKLVRPSAAPLNSLAGAFSNRCLFSNSVSGDLLCFAIRRLDGGLTPALGLGYYAANAPESQLELAEAPGPNLSSRSATPLRVNKVRLDDVAIPKTLAPEPDAGEFSFILEAKGTPNLLAHGYVIHYRNLLLYVQHTSAKAITPELAEASMQRWLAILSPTK